MNAFRIPLFAGLGLAFSMVATQAQTLLLREPSLSSDSIAFVYAGDIWVADRQGQQPRQLTTHAASEFAPKFSPDGRWIAFSANYDNNTDVYVIPVQGQTVIYEAGGALKTLDLASGKTAQLNIALNANTPQTRVQWKDLSKTVTSVQLSATGKRVLVSARGEVFTVPAKEGYGSVRNLTQTAGLREKDALWSPDGKRVAFIAQTEANVRRHELVLVDQSGQGAREHHALAEGYFTLLDWAPDGKILVLQDNHLKLYAYTLTTRQ